MLANAHKTLALYFERYHQPPDLDAMARHRRTSIDLLRLAPQDLCPICADELAVDAPGLVALGCFHMYHRRALEEPLILLTRTLSVPFHGVQVRTK